MTLKPSYVTSKLTTYLFGAAYNDMVHGKKRKRFDGALPVGRKVAIFLIFPAKGLRQSHLDALAYIQAKGYAPIVVSNHAMSDEDRARLLPEVSAYIERYNYGYDFGGYRDGILEVKDRLADLEKLVLLNDSCWFPLPNGSDWIRDAEALDLDFVGAASHQGYKPFDATKFRTTVPKYDESLRRFHYTSFALMIGPKILADEKFLRFWKRFPLTNVKRQTIRRGEIGLSRWVRQSGYSHGSTLDLAHMDAELAAFSDQKLRDIITEMAIFRGDTALFAIKKDLLENPATERADLIKYIQTSIALQHPSYAMVEYLVFEKKYPFLKKAPIWLMANSSQIMLRLVARLETPLGETIRQEAQALAHLAPEVDEVEVPEDPQP